MYTWLFGSATRAPVLLQIRSSKAFIIATVATAIFTDIILYAIIVPVLPFALTQRAHVETSSVQTWISTLLAVYGAALLVASPFCGWIADRIDSRRWPMLLGLVALAGSTGLLCFGRSIGAMAAGRVLQGISAAVVWIVGLALLVDTVGPEDIGQAMGYVGLGMSAGTLLAPLLGGLVFARAGYYAVFAIAFGLMIVDVILRILVIEKKLAVRWVSTRSGHETQSNDATRIREQAITDVEAESGNTSEKQKIQATYEVSVTEVSATTVDESRSERLPVAHPRFSAHLPPVISLLASRRLLSALWCCTAVSTLYTALDATLPIFVKDTFRWNSVGAGLIFLTIFVPCLLSPIIGSLSDKHGPRWFAVAGLVVVSPCLVLLRLVHQDSLSQKVLLCALLAVIGTCLVAVITPVMAEVTYAIEAKTRNRPAGFFGKNGAYAQGYSLFNVAWAGGSMIGPLLGGLVQGAGGWPTSTMILGCIAFITAVPAAIWTGGKCYVRMVSKTSEPAAVYS